MTDREALLKTWDESAASYTWVPAWKHAFADLTPQQAAWSPATGRKSIWQNLNHLAFWHEVTVDRLKGKDPTEAEIEKGNFEAPAEVTAAAWQASQARFERAHKLLRDAMADQKNPVEKFLYLLPHASYHLGQIMYLRALQGIAPVSYG